MVREAARRGLTLLAAATLLGSGAAVAQDLCALVTLPAELGLSCTGEPGSDSVAVAPTGGTFAALSRMTIRPLARNGGDAIAWTDPAAWLRGEMTPDLAGLSDALAPLAQDPDSPFSGGQATAAIDSLRRALAGLSTLPLTACDEPAPAGADRWRMRCDFTSDGVGLFVTLQLLARDDHRWGVIMRAANEQRLRHFEAIANSFQPS